ncbi:MAG: hypothetical protein BWY83_01850 [bacterium ADurb.Bin478]|nr:MAG: hypothetical protein BWY83_01850 [bacterium ADurb.Bin478]
MIAVIPEQIQIGIVDLKGCAIQIAVQIIVRPADDAVMPLDDKAARFFADKAHLLADVGKDVVVIAQQINVIIGAEGKVPVAVVVVIRPDPVKGANAGAVFDGRKRGLMRDVGEAALLVSVQPTVSFTIIFKDIDIRPSIPVDIHQAFTPFGEWGRGQSHRIVLHDLKGREIL